MNPLEAYYHHLPEPVQSSFLFFRKLILESDQEISESYKWTSAFFSYRGKMLCYFWVDKKGNRPYISWSEGKKLNHPELISAGRKRFKLYYFDPNQELNTELVQYFIDQSIELINEQMHSGK